MNKLILILALMFLWVICVSASEPDSTVLAKQQSELSAALRESDKKLSDCQQAYYDAQKNKVKYDTIGLAQWRYEMKLLKDERKTKEIAFIKSHPDYYVSIKALNDVIGHLPDDIRVCDQLFNGLDKSVRESPEGLKTREVIDRFLRVAVGALAPEFTANDTIGKPVSLNNFRGKYLLLDFWASWCVPCREENPVIVKAYHLFKDKNFEILSVSLDQSGKYDAWLKAIHDDGLVWTHVSDLKYWDSKVAQTYSIRSIPQNFLLDPQGKIIAINMRGTALIKKLEELLK
ncbi:peroxiredoxin family protein [Dysgonomonas reticulitermitis]